MFSIENVAGFFQLMGWKDPVNPVSASEEQDQHLHTESHMQA